MPGHSQAKPGKGEIVEAKGGLRHSTALGATEQGQTNEIKIGWTSIQTQSSAGRTCTSICGGALGMLDTPFLFSTYSSVHNPRTSAPGQLPGPVIVFPEVVFVSLRPLDSPS